MKAAVYHNVGDVRIEEVPDPIPGDGEIVLRVATAGICGTDLGEFRHQPTFFPIAARHPHSGHQGPTILGHEFSGWVAGVGAGVTGFDMGDLVASGAGVWCGNCAACLRGRTNMCARYWTVGLHANGGLADQVAVPAKCCLNLSRSGISPDLAALCQPMSIAVHATRRGRTEAGEQALVLGAGGIGSFIVHAASSTGAEVTAVDLDPDRLSVAAALGADTTLPFQDPAALDRQLGELPPPDVVFECTGQAGSLQRAIELVAENGRVVVVGHQQDPVSVPFKAMTMGERELIGTMAHIFSVDFGAATEILGRDPKVWSAVAPVVYPLDEVVEVGLRAGAVGKPVQIKVLFDPGISTARRLRV